MLEGGTASVCLKDPGFEVDLAVTANLATLCQIYLGRLELSAAVKDGDITIEGHSKLVRDFLRWFTWSKFAQIGREVVRSEGKRKKSISVAGAGGTGDPSF